MAPGSWTIHGERTSPCRFCVDFERTGIKRWGFSERVRVNSGAAWGRTYPLLSPMGVPPPPPPGEWVYKDKQETSLKKTRQRNICIIIERLKYCDLHHIYITDTFRGQHVLKITGFQRTFRYRGHVKFQISNAYVLQNNVEM